MGLSISACRVGQARTAGLWTVCWAKPRDMQSGAGKGSVGQQLHDMLFNRDSNDNCSQYPQDFYGDVWVRRGPLSGRYVPPRCQLAVPNARRAVISTL